MIALVLGTRPEIIKMSPVIRKCEAQGLDYFILHTGQHNSYGMDRAFFVDLELPEPKYNLDVGSGIHAGQILTGIEQVLIQEQPDIVLVQGNTNTVLAGALAAAKLHIRVGHVEAGLRSFDRQMPDPPRTKKMDRQFNIPLDGISVIEPTGFLEFLNLEANARLILTDSGGVQEESCILDVPCVTLRSTTERPETIDVGANVLVGTKPGQILDGVKEMLQKPKQWNNPYDDGTASVSIVRVCSNLPARMENT